LPTLAEGEVEPESIAVLTRSGKRVEGISPRKLAIVAAHGRTVRGVKKLINNPADVVADALRGIEAAQVPAGPSEAQRDREFTQLLPVVAS